MKKIKERMIYFLNRLKDRKCIGIVSSWQEGNILHVKVQRLGWFKECAGIPFVCNIEIDSRKLI